MAETLNLLDLLLESTELSPNDRNWVAELRDRVDYGYRLSDIEWRDVQELCRDSGFPFRIPP